MNIQHILFAFTGEVHPKINHYLLSLILMESWEASFQINPLGCLETCIKQEDVHRDIFLSSPSTLVVKENAVTLDFL